MFKKRRKNKVCLGMNRELLLSMCKKKGLSEMETQVLVMFYCDRLPRWQIGKKLDYSEDNISKIKKRALDKIV